MTVEEIYRYIVLIWALRWLFFILLTHEGSHREVYQEGKPSYVIFRRWWQGLFRPQVPCTPAYTAQLLALHQHRANNQYRTANQIKPTLRVSSSTQATLEQFPITQALAELNLA